MLGRALPALLCLAGLAFAGCADPPSTPRLADTDDTVGPDGLTQVTSFHWVGHDQGNMAYEFTFEFGEANRCDVAARGKTEHAADGPAGVVLLESADAMTAYWDLDRSATTLHAGPASTRSTTTVPGMMTGSFDGPFSGPAVLTLLLPGLAPSDDLAQGASVELKVECAEPFDVSDSWSSPSLLLLDVTGMEGVGATVGPMVSINALASRTFDAAGTRAHVGLHYIGDQAGTVSLESPQGFRSWSLPGSSFEFFEGKPGTYTLTMDRIAAPWDNFWFTVYGLDPLDLAAGLQPTA